MQDISSLTTQINRLSQAVAFWNAAIIILMVGVAVVATCLVIAQQMAFRRADALASVTSELSRLKERGSDQKLAETNERAGRAEQGAGQANERAAKAQASLATAEQNSAEANAKAEGFRLDIARANESAAKAQAQVAGAMAEAAKANLELERLRTPRSLTAAQQARLAVVLRQFPGQQFSLSVNPDPETIDLMNVIEPLLISSGWVKTQAQLGDILVGDAGTAYFSGVFLDVSPNEVEELRPVIHAVAAALSAEGIAATPRTNVQLTGKRARTINIGIGRKP